MQSYERIPEFEKDEDMSRPRKCRKVCRLPEVREFLPAADCRSFIQLTVDEYESIRLIDKEGFSQEECAGYMQVARTTVQMIYNSARSKLADALVGGIGIRIEGGDYTLCSGEEVHCHCGGCCRHRNPPCSEATHTQNSNQK